MSSHDYENYGAFKQSMTGHESRLKSLARRLGLRNRYVRFLVGVPKNGAIVELGCGDGTFMRELRNNGFADIRGVDLSPSYAGAEDVHIGDAAAFLATLPTASLDAIVALDVFEHLAQDELRALLRVSRDRLRSGGRIVFRVPNMGSPLAMANQYGDLSHVTAFNEISVCQVAFDAALDVAGIYPEPLSYPRSVRAFGGMALWPIYRFATKTVLAAFGVRQRILTPNLVAILHAP